MESSPRLTDRLWTSIVASWGYAVVYSIIAVVLFALSSGPGRVQASLLEVIAVYWIAATIIGVLVGMLRPLATSGVSRAAIGFVAVWPAALGIYVVANQTWFSRLDGGDYVVVTLLALVYGVVGSTMFRRETSSS